MSRNFPFCDVLEPDFLGRRLNPRPLSEGDKIDGAAFSDMTDAGQHESALVRDV